MAPTATATVARGKFPLYINENLAVLISDLSLKNISVLMSNNFNDAAATDSGSAQFDEGNFHFPSIFFLFLISF